MITTEMRSHVYYAHRGARNFRMNQFNPKSIQEFRLNVRHGHVARKPPMPDPAEHVPANRPEWWGDHRLNFGTLRFGVART